MAVTLDTLLRGTSLLRSDKKGQNVYGPTHEFLTLHYFALDSAASWEQLLDELLPQAKFPGAVVRRAVALSVFKSCHIAPSHQRFPHVLWIDSINLVTDLLLDSGAGRFLDCLDGFSFEQMVALRGFSAGSFSELHLLQIMCQLLFLVSKAAAGGSGGSLGYRQSITDKETTTQRTRGSVSSPRPAPIH